MRILSTCLILLLGTAVLAQPVSRQDKKAIAFLKESVAYLSDDRLEGRRTGSEGEKLAYTYIANEFSKAGIEPKGDNGGYTQAFDVYDGRQVDAATSLYLDGIAQEQGKDFFPLSYSANANNLSLPSFSDKSVYQVDIKNILIQQKDNPHVDLKAHILSECTQAEKEGRKLVIITNSSDLKDEVAFEPMDKTPRLSVPVIFIRRIQNSALANAAEKKSPLDIRLTVSISEKKRTGHNVVGFINNNAAHTIIIGAHYDHLGYGEDKNSLYAGGTPMIHNGADDNASGTASLIMLGKKLKKSSLNKYNYLLLAFSGEELGLYGSKYFTEHSPIDLKTVNYMINMDMVGRLNDSSKAITIGGYGTSPSWPEIIRKDDDHFRVKIDSSGTGPSDHTSFYRKDIPVLFFFTGTHSDYHKPGDDADKINYTGQWSIIKYIYRVIEWSNEKDKLAFTKTREAATSAKSSFKVSLGVMPDYTFSGQGLRVDGVSEGKAAQKAGILAGDIIIQLGTHSVNDVQGYMQALGKFSKGESTRVKIKRGTEELELQVQF